MIKRILLALSALLLATPAFAADTPNPVTPGYQVCSNSSGATICGFVPVDATHPLPVTTTPIGATLLSGNASGTTGAVVGTLAAASGKTTSICTFNVSASGSGSVGPITIAGLLGGSQTYQLTAPGSVGMTFSPCLPASAVNTAITITTTADASATAVNVNSSGYRQ